MKGHAVLHRGYGADLLFGAEGHVLFGTVAVGDDPPEAAEAVRALEDLRDGHGAFPCPGGRCRAGRQKVVMRIENLRPTDGRIGELTLFFLCTIPSLSN